MSPQSFGLYFNKLKEMELLQESEVDGGRLIVLTEKGASYIREYMAVLRFIREFQLEDL